MSIKHVAIRNSKVESTSMARSNRLRVEVPRTKKWDRCRFFLGRNDGTFKKKRPIGRLLGCPRNLVNGQ